MGDDKDQAQIPVRFTGPYEMSLYEYIRKKSFDTKTPMAELVRDLIAKDKASQK
jgi:hypothetical protein